MRTVYLIIVNYHLSVSSFIITSKLSFVKYSVIKMLSNKNTMIRMLNLTVLATFVLSFDETSHDDVFIQNLNVTNCQISLFFSNV